MKEAWAQRSDLSSSQVSNPNQVHKVWAKQNQKTTLYNSN